MDMRQCQCQCCWQVSFAWPYTKHSKSSCSLFTSLHHHLSQLVPPSKLVSFPHKHTSSLLFLIFLHSFYLCCHGSSRALNAFIHQEGPCSLIQTLILNDPSPRSPPCCFSSSLSDPKCQNLLLSCTQVIGFSPLSNNPAVNLFGFICASGNSVILDLSQVQAPAPAPVQTGDPKNKPECYGVFCLTYDLKAVSFLSFIIWVYTDLLYGFLGWRWFSLLYEWIDGVCQYAY